MLVAARLSSEGDEGVALLRPGRLSERNTADTCRYVIAAGARESTGLARSHPLRAPSRRARAQSDEHGKRQGIRWNGQPEVDQGS